MEHKVSEILKTLRSEGKPPTEEVIKMVENIERWIYQEIHPDPDKCGHRWTERYGMTHFVNFLIIAFSESIMLTICLNSLILTFWIKKSSQNQFT